MDRLGRLLACASLALAIGSAGGGAAAAMDVSSSGGPPSLVVHVPDSAVVTGDEHDTVFLAAGRLPFAKVTVEPGDAGDALQGSSATLDHFAANVFNAIASESIQVTAAPVAAGRETIAGAAAYLYKGAIATSQGLKADVEVWIIPIDAGHTGFLSIVGQTGDADTAQLEQAVRAASLNRAG